MCWFQSSYNIDITMYKPIGLSYGNQTLTDERLLQIAGKYTQVWLPGCWAGLAIDLFVIITFFIFTERRRFPILIMGLSCVLDSLHFLRELVKGSPIPSLNEKYYWSPTQFDCAIMYLWIAWVEAAQYVLSIILAFTAFMAIVQKQDLTYAFGKRFYWILIMVFFAYPSLYIIALGSVAQIGGYHISGNSCAPLMNTTSIIAIAQCCVALCLLIFFIGSTLRYVRIVIRKVQHVKLNRHKKRDYLFTVQFIMIILLQITPHVTQNVYYLMLATNSNVSAATAKSASDANSTSLLLCWYLNAVIVFCTNRSLHNWMNKKYEHLKGQVSGASKLVGSLSTEPIVHSL